METKKPEVYEVGDWIKNKNPIVKDSDLFYWFDRSTKREDSLVDKFYEIVEIFDSGGYCLKYINNYRTVTKEVLDNDFVYLGKKEVFKNLSLKDLREM